MLKSVHFNKELIQRLFTLVVTAAESCTAMPADCIHLIDEKHTYSKEYLEAMITYALGGRAAEKIIFKQFTTGAGNDIERATNLAHKMVCEWGMSERMGPLAYGTKEEEIFLGREITRSKNYSETTAVLIDEEVKKIVTDGMDRAEKILTNNTDILHRLAGALLDREILDGDEIDKLIRGEELPTINKKDNELNQSTSSVANERTATPAG